MKKLRWIFTSLAVVACALFGAVQLGWLCPHPQHWIEGLLYATHLKTPPVEPPDFDSNDFIPEEPMDLIPYEPAVCEIHHTGMRAEIVPIHYGTPISMFRDKDSKRLLAPGEIDPERANGAGATRSLPPGGREFLFRSENDRVGI